MIHEHVTVKNTIGFICAFIISFSLYGCDVDGGSRYEPPLNSKVIMIGDSYFDSGDCIANELELMSGESYRHYYRGGAMLLSSETGIYSIPQQYQNGKADDHEISTVIMNGGCNDIFYYGGGTSGNDNFCSDADSPECRDLVDAATDAARALITQMKDDGVTSVIYLFYPHLINDRVWVNAALDDAFYAMESVCTESEHCYLIDPVDDFEDHPEYFMNDNLHPSAAGFRELAYMIWGVMVNNEIEQD